VRVSIVIPALNEEDSIGRVLDQIPFDRLPETEVIVVDNGSRDGTAEVAVKRGARVVFEPHKGYGVATRRGLSEAKGDIVVTMDADGGHWPGDLPNIVRPVDIGSYSAALGVRIHSYPHGMRIRRFLGNVLLARFFNTLYRERLSDVQCGFRAIHRNALAMLKLTEDGMQFTTELLIELKEKGISIAPVQVEQVATKRSHLKEVQDFAKHVALMLRRFPGVRLARSLEAP
jgi:glycosyltransferase involved in cell wall biosynthesis